MEFSREELAAMLIAIDNEIGTISEVIAQKLRSSRRQSMGDLPERKAHLVTVSDRIIRHLSSSEGCTKDCCNH